MAGFLRDRQGSATRWFALTAVAISAASVAGAHGLAWLADSGRVSIVAFQTPGPALRPGTTSASGTDIDDTPTGSIPASRAVMIRVR